MPTIIRRKNIKADTKFSYPVLQEYGIDASTVDQIDPPFAMFHAWEPPAHKSRPHYHPNCARGTYYLKGRIRDFFGPDQDQVLDIEAGDYLYTPKGEVHHGELLSDSEPVEIVCVYVGVTSRNAAGKIDVDLKKK
jgi:mannose-6-phosphate isomerase-like protein (cupin superfamily)